MSWEVNILGANSAVPTVHRYPSGQVINLGGESIMIDCGEGSQLRMLEYDIKSSRISTILISHLHGDHIYGLPGLLTSFNLFNRRDPLQIIGPEGIGTFVEHTMNIINHDFTYPLDVQELSHSDSRAIMDQNDFQIYAYPLVHRIPTYGYKILEKINRTYLSRAKVQELELSDHQIQKILSGESVEHRGRNFDLSDIERYPIPRSYAYVSDTVYFPECANLVGSVRLLYHEATFLESEQNQATGRYHSTAREAGRTAHQAPADHLLLGHFSSRYTDIQPFKTEAETIFRPVSLARSGKKFIIPQEGEILEEKKPLFEKK